MAAKKATITIEFTTREDSNEIDTITVSKEVPDGLEADEAEGFHQIYQWISHELTTAAAS